MPQPGPGARRRPFLSVPAWDLSEEEIREWKQTPGKQFAAYTAERIRDGQYDSGQELYPPGSPVYQEITRDCVDQAMRLLAERGMTRQSGDAWHALAPGRMEPDVRRAITVLLARHDELPATLAHELDSWNATLEASGSEPADSPLSSQPRTSTAAL